MNRNNAAVKQTPSKELLNNLIIDSILDIKGKEIVLLDLRSLEDTPTDFFIICEGDSNTQVRAIAENIQRRAREELNVRAFRAEGMKGGKWILVDFFDTVVHVFYRETREFYDLESLWNDAKRVEFHSS